MLTLVAKRSSLTPKALLHQKYGNKACYKIEEVQESIDSSFPGLALPQQVRCRYRCCLELPELTFVSDAFMRKKDAEQAAAQMAIEKLGIQAKTDDLTPDEAWDELVARISYLFSEKFLSSAHPLVGHFREAIQREGVVPISIIAACDAKINNLCKLIDPKGESDPLSVVILILKAARQCVSVCISGDLWIKNQNPFFPVMPVIQSEPADSVLVEAICIPCSYEGSIETLNLNIVPNKYYMDEIARSLGVCDSSLVLMSRTVGKASSEMRLYFSALGVPFLARDSSLEFLLNAKEHAEPIFNERASCISGQNIYGDAILANVGYTWRSPDLLHEDVSLGTYYRMLLNRLPDGGYKLLREAILAAELPTAFTTRLNWKGPSPRELLCTFCRQHRLSEPAFSLKNSTDIVSSSEHESMTLKLCGSVKSLKSVKEYEFRSDVVPDSSNAQSGMAGNFRCELCILSKGNDVILEYIPEESYRKQNDAIQNASLKVLMWLNEYFKQPVTPMGTLSSCGYVQGIHINQQKFCREFELCLSIHGFQKRSALRKCSLSDQSCTLYDIEGPDSGVIPSQGFLACISYTVALVREGEDMKELLESKDEFEFEVGTGAVTPQLETCVTQLSINQKARFSVALPSKDLILAAAGGSAKYFAQLLSSDSFNEKSCYLEYSVKLLGVTEPLEDRMEQALFSPSLSKQRVEYALRHISESQATTLVDFGCGSGSLLESLLEHTTTLQNIVGVDMSRKSLNRAAKTIHSKLSMNANHGIQNASIKFAELYYGSITDFDPRLYAFDIGTCLEVVEHMKEDQAHLFGEVVLGSFRPHLLIVSTPNYEYNSILQKAASPDKEEDADDKPSQTSQCRFRNFDHKFEWTREQFNHWASNLASRHNYSVEFGGVGGSAEVEPGFASQIAVFRRSTSHQVEDCMLNHESSGVYERIWEWNNR
ncbi:Small RNA 2'-O-methyltransferase [Acorus calamus]|uniref:Small RNA 2'-O-methyltransferase n=1 Tax=Acorus calamus TaxID=4465 RepID=A0AAV9DUD0_ACOCL|nr:Small RNA 2'-O-methyltransferase [Acorus calamus]